MGQPRFLTFTDYYSQIQLEDLQQIVLTPGVTPAGSNFTLEAEQVLINMEMTAQEEISSYIRNRYIVDQIFAKTQQFSTSTTYFAKNLVVYSEPAYDPAIAYMVGQRFSYLDNIYSVLVPGPYLSPLISDPSQDANFAFVVQNAQFFYANLPIPEYNKTTNYNQGDLVWFADNAYVAKQNVSGVTPGDTQNLEARYGIPSVYSNFMGNTTMNNSLNQDPSPSVNTNYWALYSGVVTPQFTGPTYSFSNKLPDNTLYWTPGDNRNPLVKMYMIDILLYHVHSRINPRNIPELRAIRYDGNNSFQTGGAIGWLKNIEKGKVNLNAPEIVLTQGGDIRFGSYPKKNNYF
jgi:hypothetical protein